MARKPKPKMVRVPVMVPGYHHQLTVDGYDLEGTIDDAISALEILRAKFPDKKLILDWQEVKYEDYKALHVYEERPETAKEVAAREGTQAQQNAAVRKLELAQLAALKAKYPDA